LNIVFPDASPTHSLTHSPTHPLTLHPSFLPLLGFRSLSPNQTFLLSTTLKKQSTNTTTTQKTKAPTSKKYTR
jgi:hypothetical protein